MRQLGLARSELSEGFGDGHRLDAAAQQLVQLAATGRQAEDVATINGRLKPNRNIGNKGKTGKSTSKYKIKS